jgi:hypothetical protein
LEKFTLLDETLAAYESEVSKSIISIYLDKRHHSENLKANSTSVEELKPTVKQRKRRVKLPEIQARSKSVGKSLSKKRVDMLRKSIYNIGEHGRAKSSQHGWFGRRQNMENSLNLKRNQSNIFDIFSMKTKNSLENALTFMKAKNPKEFRLSKERMNKKDYYVNRRRNVSKDPLLAKNKELEKISLAFRTKEQEIWSNNFELQCVDAKSYSDLLDQELNLATILQEDKLQSNEEFEKNKTVFFQKRKKVKRKNILKMENGRKNSKVKLDRLLKPSLCPTGSIDSNCSSFHLVKRPILTFKR